MQYPRDLIRATAEFNTVIVFHDLCCSLFA